MTAQPKNEQPTVVFAYSAGFGREENGISQTFSECLHSDSHQNNFTFSVINILAVWRQICFFRLSESF